MTKKKDYGDLPAGRLQRQPKAALISTIFRLQKRVSELLRDRKELEESNAILRDRIREVDRLSTAAKLKHMGLQGYNPGTGERF